MIQKIGITASFDDLPQEVADEKSAKKYLSDVSRGSKNITLPFYRTGDDIKFVLPIVPGVPMIAFPIIHAAKYASKVSVCGPKALEELVRRTADAIDASGKVVFVEEGENPRYTQTLENCMSIADNGEMMGFILGDVVLAYNLQGFLSDSDTLDDDAVWDFNARENVFPHEEFFSRNYYDHLIANGKKVSIKEPNMYHFNRKGLVGAKKILKAAYENRKGGQIVYGFIGTVFKIAFSEPGLFLKVFNYINKREHNPHPVEVFERIMNRHLMTQGKLRIKVEHTDPWRVRDIDGFSDLKFYQTIFSEAKRKGMLDDVYPYGKELAAVREAIAPVAANYPALADFDGYLKEKIDRINKHLGANPTSVKRIFCLQAGDRIGIALEYLRNQYMPDYKRSLSA